MENLNLNLDGFATSDELKEVARVLRTLEAYAHFKAYAMENRAQGKIQDALAHEQQCEYYYKNLPDWAKW